MLVRSYITFRVMFVDVVTDPSDVISVERYGSLVVFVMSVTQGRHMYCLVRDKCVC